ncbi:hypothetical protein HY485_04930 [Candidatus Woesearchaeota archaeon]|nr:hypothetical protein [Candidatus Woesearchaeota archaeon]
MDYRLNFLPEDVAKKPQSCGEIVKRAYEFKEEYLKKHSDKKSDRLNLLFQDLANTRFWGVLSLVDGCYNHSNPDSPEKMQLARVWAKEFFTESELEDLLNICVNEALLAPLRTGWPGSTRGHKILYRELVEKPDSLFKGFVDEEFRKRLNNGRLWELLPDLSPGLNNGVAYVVVSDVLDNHLDDISVSFVPKGFELYCVNYCSKPYLCWLSDKTIDNYVRFVELIDCEKSKVGISEGVVAELLVPYVLETVTLQGFDDDYPGLPRFDGEHSKDYKARLQEPFVAQYLAKNDVVRDALAKDLSDKCSWGDREDFVFKVIEVLPDPFEFLSRVSALVDGSQLRRDFLQKIRKMYSQQ